jgi:histidine triad (HIT) family protein
MSNPPARATHRTIFEKIIHRELPARIVYEDDHVVAFHDIRPQAPTHLLVVPRHPVPRVGEATPDHQSLLGHLLLKAAAIARQLKLDARGYRLVINNGPDGGETVPHLHVHLLAGRPLGWPPG